MARLLQWGAGAERAWQRIGGGWVGPLWLTIVFIATAWGFAELADDAPEGDYLVWENAVLQSFRHDGAPLGGEAVASALRDVTALGGSAILGTLTLLILGYLWLCGRYRVAILLAIATAGGQALNLILKQSFARERPAATLHLVEVNSPSFPSGHSMAASIFYLTSGALLARTARRKREKAYLLGCALLVTLAVGFSRVYLGVHYPTDVLAGWCAGAAWAILCLGVADGLARRGALRTPAEAPPTGR